MEKVIESTSNLLVSLWKYGSIQIDWLENFSYLVLPLQPMPIHASFVDTMTAIFSCYRYRMEMKTSKSWFEVFIACIIMTFGGTTLVGLLIGQTPGWMLNPTTFPAFLLSYWLTFHCPFDLYWQLIVKGPLGAMTLAGVRLFVAISSGYSVTSRGVDRGLYNTFNVRVTQSPLTCIVAGTLAASGGGLLTDLFGIFRIPSFTLSSVPSLFDLYNQKVGSVLTRSFLLSSLYYVVSTTQYMIWNEKGLPLLSKSNGHCLIVVCQLLQYFATELFGIDLYVPISHLLMNLLLVKSVIPADEVVVAVGDSKEKDKVTTTSTDKKEEKKKTK